MAKRPNSETITAEVGDLLRADILSATWPPGSRLSVRPLSERYHTSTTVAREALAHLAGDWLVQLKPNRGWFVTDLNMVELSDLTELRCRVEEFGVALAVERGDLTWESQLVAVHHVLESTPRRTTDSARRISSEWMAAHRVFHSTLLQPCQLDQLVTLSETLSDLSAFYRQLVAPTPMAEARNVEDEHRGLLDAALARDAALTGKLLREHYGKTLAVIAASGAVRSDECLAA